MRSRLSGSIILILVMALFLAACNGAVEDASDTTESATGGTDDTTETTEADDSPATTEAGAEPTTISLSTWMWDEPGIGEWWRLAVQEFEAQNPDVTVEVRNLPINDYEEQIVVELAAGEPADIVTIPATQIFELAPMGQFIPLDDFLANSDVRSRIRESGWEFTTIDGQVMAMPVAGRTLELLYNARLFDEAGLTDPPTSPEEFLDYARRLTIEEGGDTVQFGASMVHTQEGPTYEMLLMWSLAFGGNLTDGENATLTDPAVVEALTFMKTLFDEGLIPRGLPEDDQRALFANGTTAMEIDGSWQIPFIEEVNPDDVENIMAARVPWGGPSTGGPNIAIAVGQGDHADLAWKFLELLATDEIQQEFGNFSPIIPFGVNAFTEEQLEAKPFLEPYLEGIADDPVLPVPAGFEDVSSEFQDIVLGAVVAAIEGGEDPATALERAQSEIESRLG